MVETLGLLAELFTWVGFAVGGVFLLVYLLARLVIATRVETDAVILRDGEGLRARWLADDGELYERPIEPWEREELGDADHCRVFYRRLSPRRAHLVGKSHTTKALGVLTTVFLALGVAAVVGSLLLLALDG